MGPHAGLDEGHQFQRPRIAISDGTRSARTIVASMRTARAMPTPISFTMTICEVAKAPTAIQRSVDEALALVLGL